MRFMMLMYPGPSAEKGVPPSADMIAEMFKYNEQLGKAGALIALDGVHASSKGARVRHADGKVTVTDGPFTETKEILGGFWIINAASKEEAVEWAKRVPDCGVGEPFMVEVRQVYEFEDFPPETRAAMQDMGLCEQQPA